MWTEGVGLNSRFAAFWRIRWAGPLLLNGLRRPGARAKAQKTAGFLRVPINGLRGPEARR